MTVVAVGTGVQVREFDSRDRSAVLRLVREDMLPGRPTVTGVVLDHVLEQEGMVCDVLTSVTGEVLGVVGWALHAADAAGLVLWLHCRDDEQRLAEVLVQHVLGQFGRRQAYAYTEATALAPIGLPVFHRPGTRRALEACGFSGTEHARYLHHHLDTLSSRLYAIADLTACPGASGWRLNLRERDGTQIGEAHISEPVDGTAELDWIILTPQRRHLGHILLEQCLTNLADRGIDHVTTCIDAPDDDHLYREDVIHLHQAAGFTEVDHLYTYTRCP
ncbi:hypothetical protein ACFWC5_42740 [Streptomyces sp. NPDC060085]|uniref:hypothetical protein n=1 Tax=Streptomyces sp. NPDC060085 TaxID=3347054 RepID=UPI00364ED0EB